MVAVILAFFLSAHVLNGTAYVLNGQYRSQYRGVATYYPAEQFAGQPLYCNYQDERLVYDESLEPWIAVDVELYRSGQVRCGDEFLLIFEGGHTMTARAWDAGMFDGYYVVTWPELPIVVDLPEHLRPPAGAARVVAFNVSAWERTCSEPFVPGPKDQGRSVQGTGSIIDIITPGGR